MYFLTKAMHKVNTEYIALCWFVYITFSKLYYVQHFWFSTVFMASFNKSFTSFKLSLKGNLAHNFMDLYFLCLSFHLDISNMLKTKYIGNTGLPASHRGEKIQFGNPFKFGFPNHSPCDVITLGNSLLTKREFLS